MLSSEFFIDMAKMIMTISNSILPYISQSKMSLELLTCCINYFEVIANINVLCVSGGFNTAEQENAQAFIEESIQII